MNPRTLGALMLCGGATLGALASAPGTALAQPMTPIVATGWNRDIVVEKSATVPYGAAAMNFDVFNNHALYENGLAGSTKGLPQTGSFTSAADGTTVVQLQPYAASNVLFLTQTALTGTLTLDPAAQRAYTSLAIFASSTNSTATATGTVVINFVDGTSSAAQTFNAQDWFFVTTNNAINNIGRCPLASAGPVDDASVGNPRIYQTTLNLITLGASTKQVASLTFTAPTGGANTVTAVFAISGLVNPIVACCNRWTGSCRVVSTADCAGLGLIGSATATCTPVFCRPGGCPADYNGNGLVQVNDIFAFLGAWFAGCP